MSCRPTYDPCLDGKLNQIGSYASVARQSAQASQASATQSQASATASATSATDSQNSASEANNYLTQVENIFNEFEEKYLGAFAIAPTTDNEGDPLQVGALYWNSVTNAMFVWNGSAWSPIQTSQLYLGGFAVAPTLNNQGLPLVSGNLYWNTASNNLWAWNGSSWVRTNFNETTTFFTQFTTSGTARNLEVRMRQDISSVRDWGATGSGTTDDTLAIQNAIAFSFNDYVYFPPGTYRVTAPIVIEKPIRIIGAGSQKSFIRIDHSGNGIVFQPVGAGTSNVFLNFAEIEDIAVQRSTAITTPGTNIWIRQCNGFKAKGVTSFDGSVGFRISGGQLNSLLQCRAYVSNASMTPQPENACVIFEEAPLSGGGFQYCYTTNIEDFQGLGTNIINYGILVKSMDGLNISNAFFSFFNVSQIEFNRQSLNTQITGVNISNVYFDCTGFFGGPGTPHAITCTNARPAGTSGLGTLNVTNCILANNANEGTFNALIDFSKYGSHIKFANCYIANSGPEWGVELYDSTVGGPSGTYIFTGNTFSNLSNVLTSELSRDPQQSCQSHDEVLTVEPPPLLSMYSIPRYR
jgi:hypothetical protein